MNACMNTIHVRTHEEGEDVEVVVVEEEIEVELPRAECRRRVCRRRRTHCCRMAAGVHSLKRSSDHEKKNIKKKELAWSELFGFR